MGLLPVGFGSSSSGYDVGDIGHSLRFRGSASAYLSKTITTDATSTYFAAVKRGKLGAVSPIFDTSIKFNANDTLTAFGLTTTAVFRDPTAWLFIHVSGGGLYVNGVSFGAVTTSSLTNPRIGFDGTNYFDGYIARLGCVAGSSAAYTNFGYLNTEVNEWVTKSQAQVKAVVDAGGTNSFMLEFDNATSTTTLGYDKSSKGNNWTCNNISLTAGATYDWMLDVPGNSYATLSPLDHTASSDASEGNLKWNHGVSARRGIRSTQAIPTSFDAYFEVTVASATNNQSFGICASTCSLTSAGLGNGDANGWGFLPPNSGTTATKYNNTSGSVTLPYSVTSGDVFMFAVQRSTNKLWVGQNGTWVGSVGVSGEMYSNLPSTGNLFAAIVTDNVQPVINFGQRPFTYTPPTGFLALCQANLSDTGTVIVSGSFTGNASADGPFVWMNGVPKTLTINSNAVTFGTHADKIAGGFKLRTSSSSYNAAGSNTWTATIDSNLQNIFKYNNAEGNP